MTFNFDQDGVSCSSAHITLSPGDKVTRVRYGRHGARFFEKGIVKKVNPKKITVDIRLKGRTTGEVRWQSVSVDRQYLYRFNWQD